jgi:hypothetical protein
MKLSTLHFIACMLLICALATDAGAQGKRGNRPGPDPRPAAPIGTYTNLSGTIAQFNYDRDGEVAGFLLTNNTLVHLPPRAAVQAGYSVHTGDNVSISGFAQTESTGMQLVEALTVQDRTSGRTINVPQPGPAAPYSSSGKIRQLNYGPDGAVNGFLLDSGTLALIAPYGGGNPSSIQVGAMVSYSGYARRTANSGIVVEIQNLTINGQQFTFGSVGPAPGAPPPPPARGFAPADRTAEPPPPPPPR